MPDPLRKHRGFARRIAIALTASVVCVGVVTQPARAAWPVTDAVNAALNLQALTKQAEEIANQIQQIQNQVQMIQQQAQMLQNLGFSNYHEAVQSMWRIKALLHTYGLDDGQIGFEAEDEALDERFREAYPDSGDWNGQSKEQIGAYPDQWNAQKRANAEHAMQVQNTTAAAMTGTQTRMADLAAASNSAPGEKAAVQVTNQMLVTLSAQLQDQQAAMLALQRQVAAQDALEAAEYERNQELLRRASRDAEARFDLTPIRRAFSSR